MFEGHEEAGAKIGGQGLLCDLCMEWLENFHPDVRQSPRTSYQQACSIEGQACVVCDEVLYFDGLYVWQEARGVDAMSLAVKER